MQRRRQPVAGVDRRNEALLKGERRGQPKFGQQDVARGEAIVERSAGRPQPFGDRTDRDRRRPPRGGKSAGGP